MAVIFLNSDELLITTFFFFFFFYEQAYVSGNDLYVTDLEKHTRVTFDGAPEIFNGVPDWVYEGKKK